MIVKADPEGYKEAIAGIYLKSRVCGEKTHLIEVTPKKGAILPEHHHLHEQIGYLIPGL